MRELDAGADQSVDVAIVGGGLSANLLARQVKRQSPAVRVVIIERKTNPRWKVGESTVEIAANYLVRKHGLATYLYDNHLPKHGLRFFFDNAERSAPLQEMSEVGTDRPPPVPSFQLDRARFEKDLLRMNADIGVDIREGWTVRDVAFGEGGALHRLRLRRGNDETELDARWVIDGSGRARLFGNAKGLHHRAEEHRMASVWGRFRGVNEIDELGDDAWRGRVRHVGRALSTNHFCYPGYWIWFIPLGGGITSVGVVGERSVFRKGMRTLEGFTSFLREHRAVGDLLGDAENLDLEGFTHLAFRSDRIFSPDRWALLGDAAAFPDPFYSPGSDFISIECDFTADMIRRDLGGEEKATLDERVEIYERFLQFRYEATLLLYKDLYAGFGSYELMRAKLNFDLGCYYNLWLDPFMRDAHLDTAFLKSELRRSGDTLVALKEFSKLFQSVREKLERDGTYHRGNLGHYNQGVDCLRHWMDEVGQPRKKKQINGRTEEVFNYGRREALKLLGNDDVEADAPWRLYQFGEGALDA